MRVSRDDRVTPDDVLLQAAHDVFYENAENDDPLRAARGILFGILVSLAFWFVAAVLAFVVTRVVGLWW